MEEFSIELGAKLKLDSLQEQINKASSNLKPLEIKIDTEKSEKKITALTEQISKLNNGFKIMENMGSLSSNLDVINKSLKSIATVIDKINKADGFNNLGKGLNSFAPIAETIKNELSAIKDAMASFKGVNLNISFGNTNNKTASDAANRMALAELRQQEAALESAYGGFVNMAKRLNSAKLWNFKTIADDATASMPAQIQALRQYINAILEINAVSAKGIDLTSVTSKFSGSADEIVTNTTKIATGEKALVDQTNQLKGLFGSGIDAEKLTTQLDTIKVSIDNVSTAISGIKFDDSTLQTFKETIGSLNTTIQQLSKSITELDGKPIISKTATTGIAQTTQEIQKAEAETQKLKQTTEQATKIDGSSTLAGKQAEKAETDKVTTAYKELLSTIQQIRNIQTNLLSLDKNKDSNQILELEGQLKRLQESYQATRQAFGSKFSTEQTAEINNALQSTIDKMATVQAKIDDVKKRSVDAVKDKISNGTLNNQIQTIENDYRRLGLTEDVIAQKTQTLKSLLSTMDASDDIESVTRDYTTFGQEVVKAQNDVKALRREQQKLKDEANLANKKTALTSQIDLMFKKYSAAIPQFGARLQQIKSEIASADGIKLSNLQREVQEVKRQMELAGKATMSFGDKLKSKLGSLATYFSATMMISYAIRGIRSMFQNVLQVDTAMTELYRVTDLTEKQYSQLYDKMVAGAKKYNAALNDIINATAEWVRFGFSPDLAEQLAEITVMYQHVTDLDHKLATENLLTAYKGFQPSLDAQFSGDAVAAVEHISDVYDKLNNELPVSAAQVAEGVNKTASVLQEAGATFEQASALIVGGGSVTQDFDAMGNSIKIATLRIHGMKGKLEELGEEVDENIQSVSKIQTQILNLTHGKVNIFEDDGEHFRNIYDVFKDIASVWDSLSDTESAELLELIAGIFYQNVQRCA